MFTKILKVSLIKEQVLHKMMLPQFDGYEIHLLGKGRDDFKLLNILADKKPIKTFHYPVSECDLSVFKASNKAYIHDVLTNCAKYNSGLIMHCGTGWDEAELSKSTFEMIKKNEDVIWLVMEAKRRNVPLHIENASGTSTRDIMAVIAYLVAKCKYDNIYPLLDVCHYQIAAGRIFSEEFNLGDTLCIYSSNNYKIHFCDSVGCGKNQFGGKHGSNFKYNQPLMRQILKHLEWLQVDADLVLEVDEEDYNNPQNAVWLAERIDEYLTRNES